MPSSSSSSSSFSPASLAIGTSDHEGTSVPASQEPRVEPLNSDSSTTTTQDEDSHLLAAGPHQREERSNPSPVSTAPSSSGLLTPNDALPYPLPSAASKASRIHPHVYNMPLPRAPISGSKQVRFAYKNTVYPASSTLPVPSLSHSVSTAPLSSILLTPNDSLPYPLPSAPSKASRIPSHVDMPPRAPSSGSRYAGQARVHPYLSMDGISWDLRDHSSMITRNGHGLSSRVLSESAFEPPLPYVSIAPPHLPWSFKIHASNGRYVTLGDVFGTLYHNLRVNITEPEFSSLADKRKPTQAYEERYKRLRSRRAFEEEKRRGMKRVDLLKKHTRFLALVNSGRLPEEWLLKVA